MNLVRLIFGGIKEISARNYRTVYLEKSTPHLLIDVRNDRDFQSGHIEGATNIPLAKLGKKLDKLPKNQPIVCVCRSGPRGREATHLLQNAGFEAINLVGGIMEWCNAGGKLKSNN